MRAPGRWMLGALLLLAGFGWSAWRLAERRAAESDGVVTLRFAHFQLESGLREAFDAVIAEYEARQRARGREVRVEQVAIPSRMYATWARTQLVGGTAPDVMMNSIGIDEELRSRHFRRLGDVIERPNPYNAGTPLEGKKWRDTFLDGMEISGFSFVLMDHYSVPFTTLTTRLYVNRTLLREVLAEPANAGLKARLGDGPPQDLRLFMELCEAVVFFGRERGQALVPIASSSYNGELVVGRVFSALTQTVVERRAPYHDWRLPRVPLVVDHLAGGWSWRDPAVRAGLERVREMAAHMPPGFLQLQREDAVFYFAQGRALVVAGGSWDAPSLSSQAAGRFELAIWPLPEPDPEDPAYGRHVVGPISEADAVPFGALGVRVQDDGYRMALAVDFLQFLTSYEGNTLFSARSGWLPAVVGVEPTANLAPFMPRVEGYPAGLTLLGQVPDLRRAVDTHLHTLIAPDGGVDAFVEKLEPAYTAASELFLQLAHRDLRPQLQRHDLMLQAYSELGDDDRFGALLEMQQQQEMELWQMRETLAGR